MTAAWTATGSTLPSWLVHAEPLPTDLNDQLIAWVVTPDWDASRLHLQEHAETLLRNTADAALEHLIDFNPTREELLEHLDLLRAARASGIDTAYGEHLERLRAQRTAVVLNAWFATGSTAESQDFAAEHHVLLTSHLAATILGAEDIDEPVVRLHRGLLGLIVLDGVDRAYAYLVDERLVRLLIDPEVVGQPERRLALARLASGREPDDAEAHFQLAIAALDGGTEAEATAALVACATHSAPHQRRDFLRRLRSIPGDTTGLEPLLS